MTAVGPAGIKQVATLCSSKAHYLAEGLVSVGLSLKFDKPFFHEFVTVCADADAILKALTDKGILGGLKLSDTEILWCATELNTKEQMDEVIEIVKGVSK